jgi:hypothetical protein
MEASTYSTTTTTTTIRVSVVKTPVSAKEQRSLHRPPHPVRKQAFSSQEV